MLVTHTSFLNRQERSNLSLNPKEPAGRRLPCKPKTTGEPRYQLVKVRGIFYATRDSVEPEPTVIWALILWATRIFIMEHTSCRRTAKALA